ncbi:hypothetical protein R1sor_009434 [Riccia sorocarpa]|uniref:AFG1-like ATPase n=1 Tax=Riccia sorocarpa TaxID=122646 RepID=A0ABD3HV40_9MARC
MRSAARLIRAASRLRPQGPLETTTSRFVSSRKSFPVLNGSLVREQANSDETTNCISLRTPETFVQSRGFSSSVSASLAENGEGPSEQGGPLAEYERRIASGDLKPGDKYQEDALRALQALYDVLHSTAEETGLDKSCVEKVGASSGSWFARLMPKVQWNPQPAVRGLYLYGGVGTGKTMLMDMFFDALPNIWRKRRIHFHDFMLGVHSSLQKTKNQSDPLAVVAEEISKEAILLCLDEFMVTDVADALILNRLFDHLFRRGVILVSTSNRHPDQLYEGGLQRDLFLPFIANLKSRCVVHEIGSSTDYRALTVAEQGMYFVGPDASKLLQLKFRQVTNGEKAEPTTVEIRMGRKLQVPMAMDGCAYFQFHELCEMPLGAADYIGLFEKFHTLALDGVPKFGAHNRSSAYRFTTLIDVLYEHKARFLCSAEASPVELFEKVLPISEAPKQKRTSSRSSKTEDADILIDNDLGFTKDRTISRLTEINSSEYQEDHAMAYRI